LTVAVADKNGQPEGWPFLSCLLREDPETSFQQIVKQLPFNPAGRLPLRYSASGSL
jgi:hypothetical protein